MVPRELPLRIFHPPCVALIAPRPCFLDHLPASTLFTATPKKPAIHPGWKTCRESIAPEWKRDGRKSSPARIARPYESCDSVACGRRNKEPSRGNFHLPLSPPPTPPPPPRRFFPQDSRFPSRCLLFLCWNLNNNSQLSSPKSAKSQVT
jgi:hypothetical protein